MSAPSPALALASLRADFPILATKPGGKPLVYLDSAATSQKPRQVIDALRRFYEEDNANIHRSAHGLANRATELYERTRSHVAASSARPAPARSSSRATPQSPSTWRPRPGAAPT